MQIHLVIFDNVINNKTIKNCERTIYSQIMIIRGVLPEKKPTQTKPPVPSTKRAQACIIIALIERGCAGQPAS